jgi:hypothetical protein
VSEAGSRLLSSHQLLTKRSKGISISSLLGTDEKNIIVVDDVQTETTQPTPVVAKPTVIQPKEGPQDKSKEEPKKRTSTRRAKAAAAATATETTSVIDEAKKKPQRSTKKQYAAEKQPNGDDGTNEELKKPVVTSLPPLLPVASSPVGTKTPSMRPNIVNLMNDPDEVSSLFPQSPVHQLPSLMSPAPAPIAEVATTPKATKKEGDAKPKVQRKRKPADPNKVAAKKTTDVTKTTAKKATKTTSAKEQTPQEQPQLSFNEIQNQALKQPNPNSSLPPPQVVEVTQESTVEPQGEPKEPVIAIHVPLCSKDESIGSTQVVFNVMKMCEDKYGWRNIHPNAAKINMDLYNDEELEDDDDDDMEEDQEEVPKEPVKIDGRKLQKGKPKIGQYDFEDPFIDDSEMLWEEQRASTKDGFFVFWGPLVEEGKSARIERADGSIKRTRKRAANTTAGNAKKKPAVASRQVGVKSAVVPIAPQPAITTTPVPLEAKP